MVSSGIVAPFWGRALDRYGPRFILVLAQAIMCSGWLLRSQARGLLMFYASYGLAFLGLPGPILAVPRALAAAFPTRKGSVIGFATTGASAMSMVLVPAASTMISSFGWPTACIMFALTNMVAAIVALLSFDDHLVGSRPGATRAATAAVPAGKRPVSTCCCKRTGTAGVCTIMFALVALACNIGQLSYAAVGGSLVPCEFDYTSSSRLSSSQQRSGDQT